MTYMRKDRGDRNT